MATIQSTIHLFATLLPLGQLRRGRVLGQLLDVLDEFRRTREVLAQRLWHLETLSTMLVDAPFVQRENSRTSGVW